MRGVRRADDEYGAVHHVHRRRRGGNQGLPEMMPVFCTIVAGVRRQLTKGDEEERWRTRMGQRTTNLPNTPLVQAILNMDTASTACLAVVQPGRLYGTLL
eukprot:TRINITY_DN64281_c0_g1_i1.p3 TRINITY_DN64281_c0_g1~~TRINITY_DN64281_c0_g1_i1.p3  ORF type:complete len:100 (+),score=1.80 TRINITY_DN64281_c0_g1_i1:496-795(+)